MAQVRVVPLRGGGRACMGGLSTEGYLRGGGWQMAQMQSAAAAAAGAMFEGEDMAHVRLLPLGPGGG